MTLYAEVLLNHSYARRQDRLTYEVPEDLGEVVPGSGVMVPFQNQEKPGLVLRVHGNTPDFETRPLLSILEPTPLLFEWQMEVAEWIAEYYFCSLYDAYRLFLPKNLWAKPKKRQLAYKFSSGEKRKERHELSPEQASIVNEIHSKKIPASLIHGVTGAGKTEIYRHLIEKTLEAGKQSLLLVPEISLTPQLLSYFQGHFERIAVLHSGVSDGQRAAAWREIRAGRIDLVIGSRSALFSPFPNLGLILIDEEHEWSYKQDASPRYHAREVAKLMAEKTEAQLILGSATPSIESMHEALENRMKLFTIETRISGTELPKVELVDLREELRAQNYSVLSLKLEKKIESALKQGEQVILFLNRRGSASSTVCRDCGQAASCSSCEVKMTYHSQKFAQQSLICHHCGKIEALPDTCKNCGSTRIKHFGMGTEKVEQEIKARFPTARVARADRDTMGNKGSYENLHEALHKKSIDILIGTQMIGKGFDIPDVTLVGVILADTGLHIPDFRASERSFQLLTQVAGRSGRRQKQGEVIIQSYSPEHPALHFSQTHDYRGFYEQEISSREALNYPPFSKIIKLLYSHPDKAQCQERAQSLAAELQDETHQIYAAPALLPRLHQKYHWNLLIQGPDPKSVLKKAASASLEGWRIDVDPLQCV